MKSTYRILMLASASLIGAGYGAPAFAQDNAAPPIAAESGPRGIEDIVVTARRRDESLQNVPIAITALSGSQLEQRSLRSTEDLRTAAPGLNISGQRRDDGQFFIRGQGPGVQTTGQRNFSSVATYFAEVPTAVAGPGVFYDLASVQVLKGPQGTLFGRNTTGGAVLFEPNRPVADTNTGYIKLSGGNYDYREFEGMVNVAVVPDIIALRVAGQISRRDGFTTSAIGQKLDGRKYEAARLSLLITPTDNFENLTIVDYRSKDNSGTSAVLRAVEPNAPLGSNRLTNADIAAASGVPLNTSIPLRVGGAVSVGCLSAALPGCPTGPFGNVVAAYQAAYNGGNTSNAANSGFAVVAPTSLLLATLAQQQALGPRRNLTNFLLRSKNLDWGVTNKSSWNIGTDITLKNIIAYRVSRKNDGADYDGTPLPFIENRNSTTQPWVVGSEQFTEEFQVQGKLPSIDLEYILGYYHEHTKPGFVQRTIGINTGRFSSRETTNEDTSDALFGHLEWNPTDFLGISGGVRKTWDKRFADLSLVDINGACIQTIPGTTTLQCPIGYNVKFSAWTYDATVNLTPIRGVLVYGSYRRGYKSGGVNLPAPVAPPPLDPAAYQTFGPETVDSFEVGFKADFNIGIPVRANASAFYDKYKNVQVQQTVLFLNALGQSSSTSLVQNGINGVNKGFEFETTIVPFSALSLSGFVSYLSAHPTNDIPNVSVAGRQFLKQPKWKYGISGVVTVPVPEDYGTLTVSADYAWQDKTFTLPFPPSPNLIDTDPAYGILNARLEWNRVMDSRFDLGIFATNVTNKVYALGGYPIPQIGFDAALYGEPRMYGASIRFHFGDR